MWIIIQNFIDFEEYGRHRQHKSYDCPIDISKPTDMDAIKRLMPHKFRLSDDDGNVYYVGYYDGLLKSEDEAFAPLDWAKPHAGCTTLEYADREPKQIVVTYESWHQL
jgi:hypothetical protein